MKVRFCRSRQPAALVIQLALFSRWNHVAIEVGGWVYDATALKGVNAWSAAGFADGYDEIETVEIHGDESATLDFLEQQVGKDYDWMALLALPFRTTWQSPHRWFCSELVAKALIHAGAITLPYDAWRITPRDLHLVTSSVSQLRPST